MEQIIPSQKRFDVLDSWRGLSAIMVVLFHFFVFSHLHDLALIKNAYLFVDLFFVLSGFVITHGYLEKLRAGYPVDKFIWHRFMRVYPLHAFMLLAYLVLAILQSLAGGEGLFQNPEFSLGGLIASFALAHSFGLIDHLVWNRPSWSISGEFISYLCFVAIAFVFRKNFILVALALLAGALVWLLFSQHPTMDVTYDYGLLRCLYGFLTGVVLYHLYKRWPQIRIFSNRRAASGVEALIVAVIIGFIWFCGDSQLSFLSPLVFALCLWVFAYEGGVISVLLKHPVFLLLGRLSYSIYMVHMLVQTFIYQGWAVVEHLAGTPLRQPLVPGLDYARIGLERWHGDILTIIMLIVVIAVSYGTYSLIEKPFYEFARRNPKTPVKTPVSV
jgi:peptidoglycan/LPS O-acetylase OafA/YrhL